MIKKLYAHTTSGGAKYLCDRAVEGTTEGSLMSDYIVRLDGEPELMIRENDNEISITWDVEDVKSLDPSLSLADCRRVLKAVKENHDAEFGVNWDSIQSEINAIHEGE